MDEKKRKMAAKGKPTTNAHAGTSTSSEIRDSIQRITNAQEAFAKGAAGAMGKGLVDVIKGSSNTIVNSAKAVEGLIEASSGAVNQNAVAMKEVITSSGEAMGMGIQAMGQGVADVTQAWLDTLKGFTKALDEAGQKLQGDKKTPARPSEETLNAGSTREPH